MRIEDAKKAVEVTVQTMKDSWTRYERDYYPKKPEFDNSLHTAKDYVRLLQKPNDFLFVAEEQGKIVGVAIGEIVRGSDKTGDLARAHALRVLWSSAYWKRTAVHACTAHSVFMGDERIKIGITPCL